ncbi:hypothetical protein GWI33_002881 [Rhynchophorus ferrugineus]|uniref:Uncharacterized protein n=1 Tax=Rhynchophorus ferrugineus TaxID=354439 RepID=A0A834INL7_RHYFE|nr:hypothetical protein GWI33_002881 [Rhynchophorus ferrugineus]
MKARGCRRMCRRKTTKKSEEGKRAARRAPFPGRFDGLFAAGATMRRHNAFPETREKIPTEATETVARKEKGDGRGKERVRGISRYPFPRAAPQFSPNYPGPKNVHRISGTEVLYHSRGQGCGPTLPPSDPPSFGRSVAALPDPRLGSLPSPKPSVARNRLGPGQVINFEDFGGAAGGRGGYGEKWIERGEPC